MKDVYNATGVSDSKLSRIENGEKKEPSPFDLKKLADYYRINIISLYIMAGYLDESSISACLEVFRDVNLLSKDEKELIQNFIDFFTKHRDSGKGEKL